MQRSLCMLSPACVHAIESSDGGSRRSTIASNEEQKSRKKVAKLLLLPLKHRRRISQVLRSISSRGKKEEPDKKNGDREESDAETFASANSSELRSFSTDVDESEPPSFRLSPPPIFPAGSIERLPPSSPMEIVRKLPFGYVIGRELDAPPPPQPSATKLARKIKNVMPVIALLQLRSRSHVLKKKVGHALNEACRRGRRHGGEASGCREDDDEDVFWKKDMPNGLPIYHYHLESKLQHVFLLLREASLHHLVAMAGTERFQAHLEKMNGQLKKY
ncbi:hypothetical protein BS78_09G094200 [Paspalum vaginatum]|nr:hypothetical protein BS78_09G094200 [Paspalum vaginatum]